MAVLLCILSYPERYVVVPTNWSGSKISVIFITIKHNLYYIENKLKLHVSTLWVSSSGLYIVMKLLVHKNNILPDGIPSGLHMYMR
jgi:hypothetical protein